MIGETVIGAFYTQAAVRTPTGREDTLPIQHRLFLGGANSVRSFGLSELGPRSSTGDPTGGLTTAFSNAELRFALHSSFQLALLADLGILEQADWATPEEFYWAVGLGLRWLLPIGPLRFDVATDPATDWDRDWEFHFALGYTF